MRPTRLALAPVLASALLALVSSLTLNPWLQLLSCCVLALPVVALLLRPRLDGVAVSVRPPVAFTAGEPGTVRVEVAAPAGHGTPELSVTLQAGGLGVVHLAVPALAPGASASASVPVLAEHRGVADGWTCEVTSSAPLGLVRASVASRLPGRVVVHPAAATPVPLQTLAGVLGEGATRSVAGAGSEPHGVRTWRAGDTPNRVHWRTTARTGRLAVAERSAEGSAALHVVVRARPVTDAETQLARAAATAVRALREGATVHLAAPGSSLVVEARAAGAAATVLDWFAALDLDAVGRVPEPVDATTLLLDRAGLHGRSS